MKTRRRKRRRRRRRRKTNKKSEATGNETFAYLREKAA